MDKKIFGTLSIWCLLSCLEFKVAVLLNDVNNSKLAKCFLDRINGRGLYKKMHSPHNILFQSPN